MKFKTFAAFVAPSLVMMLLFIAAPLVSVFIGSFQLHQPVLQEVEEETCTPGFTGQTCTTTIVTRPVIAESGEMLTTTEWVGWTNYTRVLNPEAAWDAVTSLNWSALMQVDFWAALRFTLFFTLVTLPLVIGVGLAIALVVNNAARSIRGPV